MLTSLVVKVVCPLALHDSSSNITASQRKGECGR
jgi:hypothetical protein